MIFNNKRDINLPNGLIDYAENKEFSGHSKEIDFLYDGNRVEKKNDYFCLDLAILSEDSSLFFLINEVVRFPAYK